MLGLNRLTDMRFCGFDLDIFEADKNQFPDYDRIKSVKQKINEFLLKEKPFNQFETERIALYRCHCGSDCCGVITFKIDVDDAYIYWKDIRFELDDETETDDVKSITKLQFEKQHIEEFKKIEEQYLN